MNFRALPAIVLILAAVLCWRYVPHDAGTAVAGPFETCSTTVYSAGGCYVAGVSLVVQGIVIADPVDCTAPLCLPLRSVSPDITGNGGVVDRVVDIVDLAAFAAGYASPPKPYDGCLDYNCDGSVDIIDFSKFAQHYLHIC